MAPIQSRVRQMTALVALLFALSASLTFAGQALAQPESSPADPPAASSVELARARAGRVTASLSATDFALPVGGAFSYDVRVSSAVPQSFLQVRMKLLSSEGRLIYQKTYIEQDLKAGTKAFTFERETADIGLDPASYPIELSIRSSDVGGTTTETVLSSQLLVYDPEKPTLAVALIARVNALPLSDPQGRFVLDPAVYTRALEDVAGLTDVVLSDPSARITCSLSPAMLVEWRRLADGYRYDSPEGPVEVAATDPVPQRYAAVLASIQEAVASGRMELLSVGVADPRPAALNAAKLVTDLNAQYRTGFSSAFAALETSSSTGTAPAGGFLPREAALQIAETGVTYAAIDSRSVHVDNKPSVPGLYRANEVPLRLLACDEYAARSLLTSGAMSAVPRLYSTYARGRRRPAALTVTIGPGEASLSRFLQMNDAVQRQEWMRPVLGKEAASGPFTTTRRVRLVSPRRQPASPQGYWSTVSRTRRMVGALGFARGWRTDEAETARSNVLMAESDVWSGPDGTWAHLQRALGYLGNAERLARATITKVVVGSKPVTLAGTRGRVPVTARNDTDEVLRVQLTATGLNGVRVQGPAVRTIRLKPQENFLEIPVDLQGGLSGSLDVRLRAGDVTLSRTVVPLRASIIDRLVLVGGVLILLGGLLGYIIVKVRAAETAEESPR